MAGQRRMPILDHPNLRLRARDLDAVTASAGARLQWMGSICMVKSRMKLQR